MKFNSIALPTFTRNISNSSTDLNTPVKLVLNETEIKSLKELRENFVQDELLNAFVSGNLQLWLTQHYYDKEASKLKCLSVDTPNCLRELCKILGIPQIADIELSAEQKANLDAKRKIVQEFTSDVSILSSLNLIATNQEELAFLLNNNEKEIYLCNNSFSVPIRVANITYTCIGNVTIDNAFTQEQYARVGIKITGINLPTDVSHEMEEIALSAAKSNGYDDFNEKHTSLSAAFYSKLNCRKYSSIYRLPFKSSTASKYFNSKRECEQVREQVITKAYDEATKYVSIGTSKSISKETAQYYSDVISNAFTSDVLNHLKTLSNITHTAAEYTKLETLVAK